MARTWQVKASRPAVPLAQLDEFAHHIAIGKCATLVFATPHFDLAPGTLFKTQKVAGVIPKETGTGTKKLSYLAASAAAKLAAPDWSKEDMFVV